MKARNLIRTCQQQFQVEDRATQAAPPPAMSLPYAHRALTVTMSPPGVSSVPARMKVGSTGGSVKQLRAGSFKGVLASRLTALGCHGVHGVLRRRPCLAAGRSNR